MKRLFLAFAIALACTVAGNAQDGGSTLKVTTRLNADGTRTDTQKDLEARTSETKTYSASKKLIQRTVFLLDEQGREVDGMIFDAKDKVTGQVSFRYDPFGRLSEQIEKAPNGTILRRFVFRRDPNGNVKKIDTLDAQGNPMGGNSTPSSTGSRKKSR